VGAAFFVLTALLVGGLRADGMTNDEVLYIAAGHRHLAGDYRLNTTTPPLAKLLVALPLRVIGVKDDPPRPGESEMEFAYRFVHRDNDAGRLLLWARLPAVVLTLLLALAVWRWARSLGGRTAGLIALGFFAFHPSLLAHGHLAATDLPAAAFTLFACWAFARWLETQSWRAALAVGVLTGAALATRLTAAVILPALALAGLVHAWTLPPEKRRAFGRQAVALLVAVAVLAMMVVWVAYDFSFAPHPGATVAKAPAERLGLPGRLVGALLRLRLLPEAYLEGARFQLEHTSTGHPAYLGGERSKMGWPHYFVVAFAVKNTPGFLLALLAAALALASGGARRSWALLPALLPAGLLFAAVSQGHVQIGERYVLAVYPALLVVMAVALAPWVQQAWSRAALAALLLAHALPVLANSPRGHLTYFNRLAGGFERAHFVLLDSNLDWGQDLPRLAAWMRREGVGSVQLAYHGSDDPDRFGIAHEDLPGRHLYPARDPARPFTGVVVVSPNLLQGLLPTLRDPYAPLRDRAPDARAGVFFVYRLE
jgi:hypothetical protein